MTLSRRPLLIALAAGAALPPARADEEKAPPLPAVGSRLDLAARSAFAELPLLDGSRFHAADAQGQVLVLYWWASWCPFCAVQSPLMNQLWLGQRERGLRFLGLAIDKKPEDAAAYLAKRGYRFPSAWASPALAQALPKPKGLPVTLVRGRDGRLLMAEAGQLFPEDVEGIARFL
ncbi:MAG: TlpA disulfide reductase family protein [Rubrivivax sp.]